MENYAFFFTEDSPHRFGKNKDKWVIIEAGNPMKAIIKLYEGYDIAQRDITCIIKCRNHEEPKDLPQLSTPKTRKISKQYKPRVKREPSSDKPES